MRNARTKTNILPRISYLAASSVIRFFIQIVIIFLYSHQLSLRLYGQYQFIWMFLNFFSLIMLFGLGSLVLSTPLYEIKNWIHAKVKLITAVFIFFNITALVFLLIRGEYFTLTEKGLLIFLLLLQNLIVVAEAIAIKKEKEKKVFWANIIYLVFYATAHLYVFYIGYSAQMLLLLLSGAAIIKTLMLFYNLNLNLSIVAKATSIGSQWFYLGLNEVLGVVAKWIDKWVILFFLPIADFAVYFNATFEIPVFMLILSAVGNISLVELSKPENQANRKIKRLYDRYVVLMSCLVFPAFWFFLFFSAEFILTFFGVKYEAAIPIFRISIFILPVRIIYSTALLQIRHKTQLIVKGALLDLLVAVAGIAIFYPLWGMAGLALAFVISTYIQVAYYLWHTGKIINESITYLFPVKKVCLVFVLSGLAVATCLILPQQLLPLLRLGLALAITAIITGLLFLFYYKKMITNPVKRFIK